MEKIEEDDVKRNIEVPDFQNGKNGDKCSKHDDCMVYHIYHEDR